MGEYFTTKKFDQKFFWAPKIHFEMSKLAIFGAFQGFKLSVNVFTIEVSKNPPELQ